MDNLGLLLMVLVNLGIISVLAWLFWRVLTIPNRVKASEDGERWNTRIGLIFAMAGNAVGLGNFLRFPVEAIKNGGSTFILPYLVCFLLMGIPLMLVEWATGRYAGKRGIHDTAFILQCLGKNPLWKYVGVLGLFTNVVVASFYIYVESWTLSYAFYGIFGTFSGMNQAVVSSFFDNYVGFPNAVTICSWIFCLVFNLYFISRGVGEGIEKVARVGMPLLLLFGIILAIQGLSIQAGFQGAVANGTDGLQFLWTPGFHADPTVSIWSPKVWLAAAGQVFFTLSVGVGAIQCYASYIAEKEDIALNAMASGWMNEFVEVVIGAAIIIPISVGYLGLDQVVAIVKGGDSGFSLSFRTMPYLFQQWGSLMAGVASFMWFGILFFAGVTSSLAMGMPLVGLLRDHYRWSNAGATIAFGTAVFALGILPVYYYNEGAMEEYNYWAGTVALVLFASIEIILFAWIFGMERGWAEICEGADMHLPIAMKYVIKYVTPLFLIAILIGNTPEWFNRLMDSSLSNIQWAARGLMLIVLIGLGILVKNVNNTKIS